MIAFESYGKDEYLTDNVIDLEQAKKFLQQTAGGEPPLGDNWLTSLKTGTIFLSRPKQKGGVKQVYCDQFCVVEHKEITTNLLQKTPTGQQIDIWYPSLEFSRNNDYIETIAQVNFGYSEEQLKVDENLPEVSPTDVEEEGANNDGNDGDGGRSV